MISILNLKLRIKFRTIDIAEEMEIIIKTKYGNIPTSPPDKLKKRI